MKTFVGLILALMLMTTTTFAQINPTAAEEKNMKTLAADTATGWTRKGGINLGTTFTYFSQWASGGINSVGFNGGLNYAANYRKGKDAWDNTLIIGYGLLRQGFDKTIPWIKTDDRFDFTSKYGRQINEKIFYAALLNFNTQFSPDLHRARTDCLTEQSKYLISWLLQDYCFQSVLTTNRMLICPFLYLR